LRRLMVAAWGSPKTRFNNLVLKAKITPCFLNV